MSKLHIYNSLTRKKEVFEPANPPHVGLYVCGPTVYSEAHVGNLRTFTAFDVVNRYLRHSGYKVRYVRNITDVGHITNEQGSGANRIEDQAKLENLEPMEIVQKYSNNFHEVMLLFNLIPPDIEPAATGHIIEQINMVKRIMSNGYGYESNGSVYFDVKKYMEDHDYGILSGRKVDELLAGSRELDGQQEKKNPFDFAIWKSASSDHIMRWESPWGEGYPGWHLECSVMSTKYLGKRFDIHGGGMDLKFPHHECEIAQSVSADGINPVHFWMHANMLTVDGQKMSKSLGNAFLPLELISGDHPVLEKGYDPMVVRFFMLQTHYASTLDFSNKAIQASEKGFDRLMNALDALSDLDYQEDASQQSGEEISEINNLCNRLTDSMNDDFNTAETIATLFDLSKKINSYKEGIISPSKLDRPTFERLLTDFHAFIHDVLGLRKPSSSSNGLIDGLMSLIIDLRQSSRKNKDFATSDKIRDELLKLNIEIKDGKEGTSWNVKS